MRTCSEQQQPEQGCLCRQVIGFWILFFGRFQLTVELFDYLDCELKLSESGEEAAGPSRSPQGS